MRKISLETFLAFLEADKVLPEAEIDEEFTLPYFEKDILINRITFNNAVVIKALKTEFRIRFVNCIFNNEVLLSKSNINYLVFFDSSFNYSANFDLSTVSFLELNNCTFKNGFSSEYLTVKTLNIKGITVFSRSNIAAGNIESCFVSQLREYSDIGFTSFNRKLESQSESLINALDINYDSEFQGSITVFHTAVHVLSISGFNKSARLDINNVKVRLVNCLQFVNAGFLSVSDLQPDIHSIIQMMNSNIGKCELFNIDFRKFKLVRIANCNVQEIVPTNVNWCTDIGTSLVDSEVSFDHLRETYRQLKNVMLRNNDKIEELRYHQLEMDAYFKSLKRRKGYFEDKFVMWSNAISNKHGLSFWRPFWLLLLISFLIFRLNKFLLGYNKFDPALFWFDIAHWLESINPVRKFSDVYKTYHTRWYYGLAICIDVLSRILYSYLIFQFISAFRKYVKK